MVIANRDDPVHLIIHLVDPPNLPVVVINRKPHIPNQSQEISHHTKHKHFLYFKRIFLCNIDLFVIVRSQQMRYFIHVLHLLLDVP